MAELNDHNLELNPSTEISFKGPFTQVVTSHLKLKNAGNKTLCYKVKTTAPKMYCVRPNSGLIEAGHEVDVSIMLQPFEYNASERVRHKFLIQSLVTEIDNLESSEQIWKSTDRELIREIKLKCSFDYEQRTGDVAVEDEMIQSTNVSNYTQPDQLTTTFEELKKQLLDLTKENEKLKSAEVKLRKIALQDTLDNCSLPSSVIVNNESKHKLSHDIRLLIALCLIAFFVGIVVAKFSL